MSLLYPLSQTLPKIETVKTFLLKFGSSKIFLKLKFILSYKRQIEDSILLKNLNNLSNYWNASWDSTVFSKNINMLIA